MNDDTFVDFAYLDRDTSILGYHMGQRILFPNMPSDPFEEYSLLVVPGPDPFSSVEVFATYAHGVHSLVGKSLVMGSAWKTTAELCVEYVEDVLGSRADVDYERGDLIATHRKLPECPLVVVRKMAKEEDPFGEPDGVEVEFFFRNYMMA